jgi:2-keto-3-deoxy-L-rhamnonate aldolase RhmA
VDESIERPPSPSSALPLALPDDDVSLCLALTQARTVDVVMMAAAAGFDAVYVDLEHTATSLETCSMLCAGALAVGLRSFVRVPAHDHQYLVRALDTGAQGVIVPHVDDAATATRLVDVCRFPPRGHRSIAGTNPVTRYAPLAGPDLVKALDAQTVVAPMIESPQAVEAADAIAAVDGVDMLFVGTHDLTAEMGILAQFDDPRFLDAVEHVAAACARHHKVLAIAGIVDADLVRKLHALGARFFSAGTDAGLFMSAASERVQHLRTLTKGDRT